MRQNKYKKERINHSVNLLRNQRNSFLQTKEHLLAFTHDILDKQFRITFNWNESKSNVLITINAAMIAGMFLFFQLFNNISIMLLILMGVSFLFFISSFIICLVHAKPRIDAKIGNNINPRTIICIKNFNKIEYYNKIKNLTIDQMIEFTCYQISGMTQNNIKGMKLIRKGINLTILGVICLTCLLIILVLKNFILEG